jgi:hypothetical protein
MCLKTVNCKLSLRIDKATIATFLGSKVLFFKIILILMGLKNWNAT